MPPPAAPPPTLRRDLLSAYAAAGAKVASWAVVSAVVYRASPAAFAVLALVRATLGLLTYTAFGIGPAMVHELARASRHDGFDRRSPVAPQVDGTKSNSPDSTPTASAVGPDVASGPTAEAVGVRAGIFPPGPGLRAEPDRPARVLDYATPRPPARRPPRRPEWVGLYASGNAAAAIGVTLGAALLGAYLAFFDDIHRIPGRGFYADQLALALGGGLLMRLASEPSGAVIQTHGRIALDNLLLVAAEVILIAALFVAPGPSSQVLDPVGRGFVLASAFLLFARAAIAGHIVTDRLADSWRHASRPVVARLFGYGALVTVAQLADFLYAPTDFILINRLLDPAAVAAYAPAVQIDGALLLLVAGVANVLLPRSAVAHAGGDAASVRRDYVRGTLASAGLLAVAAVCVWALSPWVFRLWLGTDAPATRAILPGVLVHTVVGGSGAVGRAVLIGTGRVRAFTISVLVAGASNVVLSAAFVGAGLGLRGIVLGTVVVVVARCGVWMPWYTLRVLRVPDRPPTVP